MIEFNETENEMSVKVIGEVGVNNERVGTRHNYHAQKYLRVN